MTRENVVRMLYTIRINIYNDKWRVGPGLPNKKEFLDALDEALDRVTTCKVTRWERFCDNVRRQSGISKAAFTASLIVLLLSVLTRCQL